MKWTVVVAWLERLYRRAPRAVPLITKQQLEDAPMWTVFHGPAEDPGHLVWEIFDIEIDTEPVAGASAKQSRMHQLHAWYEEPEIDDEWTYNKSNWNKLRSDRPDDHDAALLYLRQGGTLCKVPDTMTSPYYRLLVVRDARAKQDAQHHAHAQNKNTENA